MKNKPVRISHTSKELYKNCPKSYDLYYRRKLREVTQSSALFFGKAIDEGFNTLLGALLNDGTKRPDSNTLNIAKNKFYEHWNKVLEDGLDNIRFSKADLDISLLSEEELNDSEGDLKYKSWLSLLHKGDYIIEAYFEQVIPKIKRVTHIQKPVNIVNDTGDTLNGFIDFICVWEDDRVILFDNKTTSVKYKEDSVRTSEQLATYQEAEYGEVDACGFIAVSKVIRKRKLPAVSIDIIIDNVDESVTMKTLKEYDMAISGIKAENFEENWHGCKTKFGPCPYYNFCRNGDKTGLKE